MFEIAPEIVTVCEPGLTLNNQPLGIVNFNIKKPPCEDQYHYVLLGHFIHGILLVVAFLGMNIIKKCITKKTINNDSPSKV